MKVILKGAFRAVTNVGPAAKASERIFAPAEISLTIRFPGRTSAARNSAFVRSRFIMLEGSAKHQGGFNALTQPAISYARSRAVRDLRLAAPPAFRQQLADPSGVAIRRVRGQAEIIPQGVLISGSIILAQISGQSSLVGGTHRHGFPARTSLAAASAIRRSASERSRKRSATAFSAAAFTAST